MLPDLTTTRNFLPRFFNDFFDDDFLPSTEGVRGMNVPAVNIKEDENKFSIEIAAPGLNKDDFNVNLENNILTISSEKESKDEEKDKDGKYMRREFSYCKFNRSFNLPETVDDEKIEAKHNNGVLEVNIPKKETSKQKAPKKIKIA